MFLTHKKKNLRRIDINGMVIMGDDWNYLFLGGLLMTIVNDGKNVRRTKTNEKENRSFRTE